MSDIDDFVRGLDESAAGALEAVDLETIEDPEVRMLEAARRRSGRGYLVSIKALAADLDVSVRTLRRWNNRADAPERVKVGRRHMYRRADVQHWLEQARSRISDRNDDPTDGGGV